MASLFVCVLYISGERLELGLLNVRSKQVRSIISIRKEKAFLNKIDYLRFAVMKDVKRNIKLPSFARHLDRLYLFA